MRIAVLADTHDRIPRRVLEQITVADEIWHLGDVTSPALLAALRRLGPPLLVVRGNCDAEEWPMEVRLERAGWRVLLIHIPPRVAPAEVDLLLHGHTHVPRDEKVGAVRFLNPGCLTRPNRGAPASFAWLELAEGSGLRWELVPGPAAGPWERF